MSNVTGAWRQSVPSGWCKIKVRVVVRPGLSTCRGHAHGHHSVVKIIRVEALIVLFQVSKAAAIRICIWIDTKMPKMKHLPTIRQSLPIGVGEDGCYYHTVAERRKMMNVANRLNLVRRQWCQRGGNVNVSRSYQEKIRRKKHSIAINEITGNSRHRVPRQCHRFACGGPFESGRGSHFGSSGVPCGTSGEKGSGTAEFWCIGHRLEFK